MSIPRVHIQAIVYALSEWGDLNKRSDTDEVVQDLVDEFTNAEIEHHFRGERRGSLTIQVYNGPGLWALGEELITEEVAGFLSGFLPVRPLVDPKENQLGPFARESETSRKAAIANYPRSGSQRWRVLQYIEACGDGGATRDEISEALGMTDNSVRPRVVELLEGGWIKRTTRTRRSALGNDSEVLVPTSKAAPR